MEIVDSRAYVSPVWFMPVESLAGELSRSGVGRAVLVPIEGEVDNAYAFEALQRYPQTFAIVAALDAASPDAPGTLAQLARNGAAGVRLQASGRSPGSNPLAIWKAAADAGLVAVCSGTPAEISSAAFARIVETFPHLRFVVEHAGGAVQTLARFPNVVDASAVWASSPNDYLWSDHFRSRRPFRRSSNRSTTPSVRTA